MPKIETAKSIHIHAEPEKVFAVVSDLSKWRPWNPWLVTEPEARVDVAKNGKHYSWSGQRTGAGEMTITSETSPSAVELDLVFLKPFKSRAKVAFALTPKDGGTEVSWSMQSSLPFFLFFMTKMFSNLIGMDYERGLSMLKDYVETGSVPSKIEIQGDQTYPGCKYVGITTECSIAELGDRMSKDFEKLDAWRGEAGVKPAGDAFSMYHKWDLSKGKVKYTSGIPIAGEVSQIPTFLKRGEIPKLKTFVLNHVGEYRHLGNAWSTGMQMTRSKEIKVSKAHVPFETYPLPEDGSLPSGKSDASTRTAIHFAVK